MKTNNNFHILIVDDEKFNIELVAVYLKEEGYKLSFALNAEGTFESLLKNDISLILLDINMPKVDGYEVCKKLKRDSKTKDIPIIFLTAQSDIDYISQAFEVGGADYITKPFNSIELKARVKTQLQNKAYLEEIKHKQSKLAQLSITDPLTKLHNSLYFDAQLRAKSLQKKPFWFIYIKLGRFEKINKLYGYYGANKILRTFAKLLNKVVISNAVVARLHGVNFAMLVNDYDKKVLQLFQEDLKNALAKQKDIANILDMYMVFKYVSEPETTLLSLHKEAQFTIVKLEDRGERYSFIS